MTLKNAALLALVGMILQTILLLVVLLIDVGGLGSGITAPIQLLGSLIRVLASFSVAVFFYVFHKAQA